MPARRGEPSLGAGLVRAVGGALIFGLPMLMTSELWELGAVMDRLRLALLILLGIPLLVGVSHRIGFEASFGWREDLRDAAIALGIGIGASALVLAQFNLLGRGLATEALVGRIAVQAVPAALGALLARSQFGHRPREAFAGYGGTLFLMLVGALFLGLNVAPTEEMVQIAWTMTPWHGVALVALTIATMHAFVYGHGASADDAPWWSLLLRFTLVGYVLALVMSLYALWTFGRLDGTGAAPMAMATLVLAFPAGLGAAAARLIL